MIASAGVSMIHATAKHAPELSLLAAVLHRALTDAKTGDSEALEWLSSESCRWYCGRLETDQVEAQQIQALLIEAAGIRTGIPTANESETDEW